MKWIELHVSVTLATQSKTGDIGQRGQGQRPGRGSAIRPICQNDVGGEKHPPFFAIFARDGRQAPPPPFASTVGANIPALCHVYGRHPVCSRPRSCVLGYSWRDRGFPLSRPRGHCADKGLGERWSCVSSVLEQHCARAAAC